MLRWGRALLVVVAASCVWAQTPQPRRQGAERLHDFLGLGAPPDAAAAARGEKTFSANCAFCHGAKATGGDTGPDLVRSALVLHDEKGELIGPVVHKGRTDRGMPAFAAFNESELYDIAEFLHLRVELTANRGTYKLLNVVTGDAKAGEAYFRGPGGCTGCHSVTGDLAHIGSKMSPADLQQAFLYPAARGFGVADQQNVKVRLPGGEEMQGHLKYLDDFHVGFEDAEGEFHSMALTDGTKVELEDKLIGHRKLLDRYTDADMHNLTAYLVSLQ